ncbi:unnamed protein product, partial [Iphiclides podalirius]
MVYVYGAASVAASSSAVNKFQRPGNQHHSSGGGSGENKQVTHANHLKTAENARSSVGFLNSNGKRSSQIGYKCLMKILK